MSNELRIGIAGTGSIGKTHIERINTKLQGGRVVAATDVNPEFGKKVAGSYGLEFFANGEALVASGKIDTLIVTSADDDHEMFVAHAVRAGMPVFCEKPLSPTAEACKRIIDLETAGGKRLVQVG
ncbi:MAG: Gfo/Idh/MocA family oxidoreductase, partial [Planctomycetota bacterium]|nr:Gfo/Idh/MocA family oxidoreductase [Planctomycetota bacterium]